MKSVRKSVLIWYSAQEMYDLVVDVERYPEFLPWCNHGKVIERTENGMTAEVGIAFKGVKQVFTTRNEHTPGRQERLHLVKGPFSKLEGVWTFTPVGGEGERACRIEFELDYGFSSALLSTLVGPVFDKIADALVDAFVERAQQVYGAAA
jgi:ribosome-associated toxin RatA of RatAB toxin-antitoxin module